jgi:hypothetical protein
MPSIEGDEELKGSQQFIHYGERFQYTTDEPDVKGFITRTDLGAAAFIEKCDPDGFLKYCRSTGATICGHNPIAVLLNISEDHLDRYPTYGEYIAAKKKIFRNQRGEDYAVLNADDPLVGALSREVPSRVLLFSFHRPVKRERDFLKKAVNWNHGLPPLEMLFSL